MAGDPAKATIWTSADVYVGPLTATDPVNVGDAFSAAWKLVGLLDGDEGFVQSRDVDTDDLFAWGGILVRTSRKNYKQTHKFTALEDNTTVRDLLWPNSTDEHLYVPTPERVRVAFEVREGTKKLRLISAYQAEIDVDGDIVDQESELTKYEFVATIYPDATGLLYNRQTTELVS